MNACVFADCNSVMQQMAAVAGDVTRNDNASISTTWRRNVMNVYMV